MYTVRLLHDENSKSTEDSTALNAKLKHKGNVRKLRRVEEVFQFTRCEGFVNVIIMPIIFTKSHESIFEVSDDDEILFVRLITRAIIIRGELMDEWGKKFFASSFAAVVVCETHGK